MESAYKQHLHKHMVKTETRQHGCGTVLLLRCRASGSPEFPILQVEVILSHFLTLANTATAAATAATGSNSNNSIASLFSCTFILMQRFYSHAASAQDLNATFLSRLGFSCARNRH